MIKNLCFEQGLSGPFVPVHVASRLKFPESETTIAEILSGSGYRTGIVGKWHLGTGCSLSNRKCPGPLSHGFDYFYGLPFTLTSDMGIEASFFVFDLQDSFYQAVLVTFLVTFLPLAIRKQTSLTLFIGLLLLILISFTWFIYTHYRLHTKKWWQVSPWMTQNFDGVVMRNHEVIHRRIPFDTLFDEIVNESVEFIHSSVREEKPFFLYLSFTHVHIPLFPSVKFRGRSAHGRYGDCIEELDSGVGIIIKALQEYHIDEDTIVYFASDHGACIEAYDPVDGQRVGGYNKEFKGGKAMGAAEGGIRVPGIFRWKGTLSSENTLNLPTSQLDLLPTFIDLADIQLNETISPKLYTKVYKMYLFRYRWEPGTYHCGVGLEKHCSCFGEEVLNISESPILFELLSDPFEDYPIDTKSHEYKNIVSKLQLFLKDYKEKNPYPPSMFESKMDVLLLPWLQPF
ncbi:Arylsulfatase H [Armadillidium nasatum]|uniref:Arylsulfatase H n=1 Tax=Armadillidium nasatum TaxID=96803 RepID=A0A5N5T915_9CRUS|nr:Arylsulfatase H [Armadillidium nasatum]